MKTFAIMDPRTDMTRKMKNILRGAGSIISVNTPATRREVGTSYVPAKSTKEALRGDMKRIGADFKVAIRKTANGEG
jgi:hypothetical protein